MGCGYSLRGLPEPRCPECGQRFKPGDPTTYYGNRSYSGRPHLVLAVLGCLVPIATFLATGVLDWDQVAYGSCMAWPIELAVFCGCRFLLEDKRKGIRLVHERELYLGMILSGLALLIAPCLLISRIL
jgi:hypothetical protein